VSCLAFELLQRCNLIYQSALEILPSSSTLI
jgi:hypothetical protein